MNLIQSSVSVRRGDYGFIALYVCGYNVLSLCHRHSCALTSSSDCVRSQKNEMKKQINKTAKTLGKIRKGF